MSATAIGILAFGLSIDAFIASLGKGTVAGPRFFHALRSGIIFGATEAVIALIGWSLGRAASAYVTAIDHWIAFCLLTAVGLHMAWHARHPSQAALRPASTSLALFATALGTSIDAMAVGVSLAFLEVNILAVALAIGAASMMMSTTGLLAGRYLGDRFGRAIEVLGGLILIGLGSVILIEHLLAG